jgi:DNA-binding transcriptional MerR regulator
VTETALAEPEAVPDDAPVSSPDAVHLAGITYRQLDYWSRAGYLKPGRQWAGNRYGSGSPRSWPEAELAVAKLMGRLTAAGLPLKTAHRIARSGQSRAEIAPGIVIEVTA